MDLRELPCECEECRKDRCFPKVIYVTGPMSGKDNWTYFNNVEQARQATATLYSLGYVPITPHLMSAFMDGVIPYEDFLDADLELIERSDGLLLLPGRSKSYGACTEILHADGLDMPFYYLRTNDLGDPELREYGPDSRGYILDLAERRVRNGR